MLSNMANARRYYTNGCIQAGGSFVLVRVPKLLIGTSERFRDIYLYAIEHDLFPMPSHIPSSVSHTILFRVMDTNTLHLATRTYFRSEARLQVCQGWPELLVHLVLETQQTSAHPRLEALTDGHQLVGARHGNDAAAAVHGVDLPEPPQKLLGSLHAIRATRAR